LPNALSVFVCGKNGKAISSTYKPMYGFLVAVQGLLQKAKKEIQERGGIAHKDFWQDIEN